MLHQISCDVKVTGLLLPINPITALQAQNKANQSYLKVSPDTQDADLRSLGLTERAYCIDTVSDR